MSSIEGEMMNLCVECLPDVVSQHHQLAWVADSPEEERKVSDLRKVDAQIFEGYVKFVSRNWHPQRNVATGTTALPTVYAVTQHGGSSLCAYHAEDAVYRANKSATEDHTS